jgi:alkylation response protein AidB-like acyl-CoA dehydrogenase
MTTIAPLTILSEEEAMFREAVASFARDEVAPKVAAMDRDHDYDPELIRRCFELGLMGIEVPEEYGGAGGSFFMSCLAIEEIAKVDGALAVFVDCQNTLVLNCLLRHATEEQKKLYLPKLVTEWPASYALSEAGAGSDAFALRCRAHDDGDSWRLEGTKLWITNAALARLFIVFATVDPSLGPKGITAFLVERDTPGFTIGKRESKLGIRASSTCELSFDGAKIPKSALLGSVGKGYKIAMETLNEGRIAVGSQMIGIARGAFDAGIAYAKERKQFGQPIAEFQGMQFQFAEAATELEAARLLVYNAARMKDSGAPFLTEAAMAKLKASRVAEKVSSMALEWFGGYGYTTEYPAEKFYRDAKIGQIYEGTSNMQLLTIAKQLLTVGMK